jgi:hypothetical protein
MIKAIIVVTSATHQIPHFYLFWRMVMFTKGSEDDAPLKLRCCFFNHRKDFFS